MQRVLARLVPAFLIVIDRIFRLERTAEQQQDPLPSYQKLRTAVCDVLALHIRHL